MAGIWMMGDVIESAAQDRVQNNLEREKMSRESGEEECRERSPEDESKNWASQKFSVIHGEEIIEVRGM